MFDALLRKHGLKDESINILKEHGVTNTQRLLALIEDDIKELGLNIGERAILRQLIDNLKASSNREKEQRNFKERYENMNENSFWCFFSVFR